MTQLYLSTSTLGVAIVTLLPFSKTMFFSHWLLLRIKALSKLKTFLILIKKIANLAAVEGV